MHVGYHVNDTQFKILNILHRVSINATACSKGNRQKLPRQQRAVLAGGYLPNRARFTDDAEISIGHI